MEDYIKKKLFTYICRDSWNDGERYREYLRVLPNGRYSWGNFSKSTFFSWARVKDTRKVDVILNNLNTHSRGNYIYHAYHVAI